MLGGHAVALSNDARTTDVNAVGARSAAQRERARLGSGQLRRLKLTHVAETYNFTNDCQSVSSNHFDTHWAWSRVCHGAEDGHRGDDEGGGLHDE